MESNQVKTCQCHSSPPAEKTQPEALAKKTVRPVLSVLLSVLIAFFPKCPICWAAYMSMFGSFGLAQMPYKGWLFPVLLAFLGLHLVLLLKKVPQKGYGPFLISMAGAAIIVIGRSELPSEQWVILTGMLLILSGSLWNSFSIKNIFQPMRHEALG